MYISEQYENLITDYKKSIERVKNQFLESSISVETLNYLNFSLIERTTLQSNASNNPFSAPLPENERIEIGTFSIQFLYEYLGNTYLIYSEGASINGRYYLTNPIGVISDFSREPIFSSIRQDVENVFQAAYKNKLKETIFTLTDSNVESTFNSLKTEEILSGVFRSSHQINVAVGEALVYEKDSPTNPLIDTEAEVFEVPLFNIDDSINPVIPIYEVLALLSVDFELDFKKENAGKINLDLFANTYKTIEQNTDTNSIRKTITYYTKSDRDLYLNCDIVVKVNNQNLITIYLQFYKS